MGDSRRRLVRRHDRMRCTSHGRDHVSGLVGRAAGGWFGRAWMYIQKAQGGLIERWCTYVGRKVFCKD